MIDSVVGLFHESVLRDLVTDGARIGETEENQLFDDGVSLVQEDQRRAAAQPTATKSEAEEVRVVD